MTTERVDPRCMVHPVTYNDIAALTELSASTVYSKHRGELSNLQDAILWLCENGHLKLRRKILDEATAQRRTPYDGKVHRDTVPARPKTAKRSKDAKLLPTAFDVTYEAIRQLTAPRKDGKMVTDNSLHQARRRQYFRIENVESIMLWLARMGTSELRQRMLKRLTGIVD